MPKSVSVSLGCSLGPVSDAQLRWGSMQRCISTEPLPFSTLVEANAYPTGPLTTDSAHDLRCGFYCNGVSETLQYLFGQSLLGEACVLCDAYQCVYSHDMSSVTAQSNEWLLCKAQIPLGSSCLDTTRSMCRAHAFWLRRACRIAWLDTLDTTS